jgi:type IV secretory pathway VirB4 component
MPIGMFVAMDLLWDKIKEDRTEKKIIYLDELWRLIGSTGSRHTAEFVYKIFKTIRKYGGGATAITQDVADFFALEGGKYGKAIINNSQIKFLLQLEQDYIKVLKDILELSEEEIAYITSCERGYGLLYAGSNHIAVKVEASSKENAIITTDRKQLEQLKQEGGITY